MNVLFVSQCTKRALTETRRILDQFAERRGERTWQTPITQAGLDTVRKLLRQNARKNTAIACHWIRGRDHSELMWIVGDARQFNAEGAAPTHSTTNDVLRVDDESTWHRLPAISALSALAALMHDLGKATQAFQEQLRKSGPREVNQYRHEWVSVRLFQAFVGDAQDDTDWLQRLASCTDAQFDPTLFEAQWRDFESGRFLRDGLDEPGARRLPFASLPPLAKALAWLILTHHRLPCMPIKSTDATRRWRKFGAHIRDLNRSALLNLLEKIDADWNQPREKVDEETLAKHWNFEDGLPVTLPSWRKQAARYARKLLDSPHTASLATLFHDPFAMHVSRLCLMLADHHYSSITDEAYRDPYLNKHCELYANTRRVREDDPSSKREFNQTLDEHLLGVQAHASLIARSLPGLTRSLPTLHNHRELKKRNANARFQWQDRAADLAMGIRAHAAEHGAFVVNMASTGCGKTLGNARIMNALADPKRGMRCAFAIGLRSLTMDTARTFQKDLKLSGDQLAIKAGGEISHALFEYREAQAEASGSASAQAFVDQDEEVYFEGNDHHPLLERLTVDTKLRSLIAAPLLACTVDHLTPATESVRGGRQIAPMLRLMTSDLVLDELDEFGMGDLPALTRLVHWAALLGARVLLSSATLPPALVQGLFLAYLDGRSHYQRNRGERPDEKPRVACLWIDEFAQSHADCVDADSYKTTHDAFVEKRCERLAKAEVRRRAQLVKLPKAWKTVEKKERRREFARLALQCAWNLHQDKQNHSVDLVSGKRVSLGLIRMANIGPLFDVARAMYREGRPAPNVRVHLCVYHSQFPLLQRSAIEHLLGGAFKRHTANGDDDPALRHPSVRALIDAYPEDDHMFIVLASPVIEVGRDFCADYAVAEPSSIRSLIQLAGRVRRHRAGAMSRPNMIVFDTNLRYFERANEKSDPVFCKPGFELKKVEHENSDPHASKPKSSDAYFHLKSHELDELLNLLDDEQRWPVDAQPRIRQNEKLRPKESLIDLEHGRMRDTMLPRDDSGRLFTPAPRDATLHWRRRDPEHAPLSSTGVLPQLQRFRDDSQPREDVVFLPSDDEDALLLHRIVDTKSEQKTLYVDIRHLLKRIDDSELCGPGIGPWCGVDLMDEIRHYAAASDQSLHYSARVATVVSLPESTDGWWWHPWLGMSKR